MLTALIFGAVYFFVAVAGVDVEVDIMSFNIRTSLSSNDAAHRCNNWNGLRKENVINNIKSIGADFVGTQETSDAQKAYLDAQLAKTYSVIGKSTGSLNGAANEWNAVYYRSKTWSLLTDGMFWLGTDPDTMSTGWGQSYYRTCVWGRFKHIATGATICIFNTHYETPGNDEAQEKSSNLILQRIKMNCDASDNLIVLVGDFNAVKSSAAMKILLANDLEDPSDEPTFCSDMHSSICSVKYDFTLFRTQSKSACYLNSTLSRLEYNGCYPSDHAGLIGTFCLDGYCCSSSSNSESGPDAYSEQILSTVHPSSLSGDMFGTVQQSTNKTIQPNTAATIESESTYSRTGGSVSTTVGIILGSMGVGFLVALVVTRRQKTLARRAFSNKLYDTNANGESINDEGTGNTRVFSTMSDMPPFRANRERKAHSPIPELALPSQGARFSTCSSIAAPNFEDPNSGFLRSDITSHNSFRRSEHSPTSKMFVLESFGSSESKVFLPR